MATKAAVSAIFHKLMASEVAGGPKTPETFKLAVDDWVDILADVTDEDLANAYRGYRRDPKACQFWPQPGTLMSYAPGRKPPVDDSAEAWGEASAWIQDSTNAMGILYPSARSRLAPWAEGAPVRPGDPPRDPIRDAAIRAGVKTMGGAIALLNLGDPHLSTDTLPALRKAFRDAYASAKTTALREAEGQVVAALTSSGPKRIERLPGPTPISSAIGALLPANKIRPNMAGRA